MGKPKGHFDVVFAVDCETTGINFKNDDLCLNYQSVSWGIIAANAETFEIIDELYVEIQHNPKYKWEVNAEKIHGLSRDYLKKNGLPEDEAAFKIGEFILEHNGGDHKKPVVLLGHNVAVFDRPFLRKLLHNNGLNFKFAHRAIDSFSVSMVTVQEYNSDDLFSAFGHDGRDCHNALDDARMALSVCRDVKQVWDTIIEDS